MIATLRYHEGSIISDGKIVFAVLAKNNAEIIKTTRRFDEYNPRVKIKVDSLEKLNKIVQEINDKTAYEVSVVKVKNEILRKRGNRQ